jgi:hypothetical protein
MPAGRGRLDSSQAAAGLRGANCQTTMLSDPVPLDDVELAAEAEVLLWSLGVLSLAAPW